MKFKDLGDLTAMYRHEVEELCKNIDGEVVFKMISNGNREYEEKRVVRYKILDEGKREKLIVELSGFPVIENNKDEKE